MIRHILEELRQRSAMRAARRWHARLHGGAASDADRGRHRAWLEASPRHSEAYAQVESVAARIDAAGSAFTAADLERLLGDPGREAPRRTFLAPPRLALAASVLLGVAGLGYLLATAHVSESYATTVAETRQHRLPDGTRLSIGADSRLVVEYGWRTREVRLQRGEAYFDVAHERRAFTVEAAGAEVTVHGTRFEVRLDPLGLARVSVADGVVAVSAHDAPDSQGVELRQGQTVDVGPRGEVSAVEALDPAQVGAWKDGRLVYRDVPLATVAADFTRYSTRRFVVNDPTIARLRVTGLFRTDDLDEALRSLESVLPVQVVNAAQDVYIVVPARSAER